MGKYSIRYLVAKRQKGHILYYWQPSRALRMLGFLPRRLAEQTNRLDDAIIEAERLNHELDRWREGLGEPTIEPGALPWLVKLYRATELYGDLAPKTQRSYEQGIALLEAWSKERGHPPISELQARHVREMLGAIQRPAMRHLAYRTLRFLLGFDVAEGHLERNPARGLRIRNTRSRDVYWMAEQVEHFIKAAEASGRPSLALAVQLGVSLGQREGDVLRLAWSQYEAGSFTLRQRKTGRMISVPATTDLRETLATVPRTSPTIVIAETTGKPYREDYFRHEFARIRGAAQLPSDLRFMDLRRTAVVRLAEAGCSVPEIAAVTGHTIDRCARILEVYLPRTAPMARAAVTRLDEARKARTKQAPKLEE
jgi:integrase